MQHQQTTQKAQTARRERTEDAGPRQTSGANRRASRDRRLVVFRLVRRSNGNGQRTGRSCKQSCPANEHCRGCSVSTILARVFLVPQRSAAAPLLRPRASAASTFKADFFFSGGPTQSAPATVGRPGDRMLSRRRTTPWRLAAASVTSRGHPLLSPVARRPVRATHGWLQQSRFGPPPRCHGIPLRSGLGSREGRRHRDPPTHAVHATAASPGPVGGRDCSPCAMRRGHPQVSGQLWLHPGATPAALVLGSPQPRFAPGFVPPSLPARWGTNPAPSPPATRPAVDNSLSLV